MLSVTNISNNYSTISKFCIFLYHSLREMTSFWKNFCFIPEQFWYGPLKLKTSTGFQSLQTGFKVIEFIHWHLSIRNTQKQPLNTLDSSKNSGAKPASSEITKVLFTDLKYIDTRTIQAPANAPARTSSSPTVFQWCWKQETKKSFMSKLTISNT